MKRRRQKILACILALPLVYGTASLPQPAWAGDAEQTRSYTFPQTYPAPPSVLSETEAQMGLGPRRAEPEAAGMVIDGLVVRPISLVATVVGAVAYVITLPFSAMGGNVDEAGEKLIAKPAAYTFSRCLGCFGR